MKRAEKKEQTRQAIINAAVQLSEHKNFAGISLREITRFVGITPAAFYRHFKDMDELGLFLIDQVGMALRQIMREARSRVEKQGSAVSTSIDTLMEVFEEKPYILRFLAGDRAGGPLTYRQALNREKNLFIQELAEDLSSSPERESRPLMHIALAADSIVKIAFNGGLDALDMDKHDRVELAQQLKIQISMVLAGSYAMYAAEQMKIENDTNEKFTS